MNNYVWLWQGALTAAQLKKVEEIANEVSKKNDVVYVKDTPLAQAKAVKGLRAVFDEVTFLQLKSLTTEGLFNTNLNKINNICWISLSYFLQVSVYNKNKP